MGRHRARHHTRRRVDGQPGRGATAEGEGRCREPARREGVGVVVRAVPVKGGLAAVNDGCSSTVSVKSCVALGEMPFEAVMVMG